MGRHFDIHISLQGNGSFEIDHAMSEEFFRLRHGFFYFHYIEYDKHGGSIFCEGNVGHLWQH